VYVIFAQCGGLEFSKKFKNHLPQERNNIIVFGLSYSSTSNIGDRGQIHAELLMITTALHERDLLERQRRRSVVRYQHQQGCSIF
jgi:hypothetical protein